MSIKARVKVNTLIFILECLRSMIKKNKLSFINTQFDMQE